MKGKKISEKYWNTLRKFEQEYVKQRINKDDIPTIKNIINCARKQVPDFVSIYGKGFIKDSKGNEYLFSGNDTKKYRITKQPLQALLAKYIAAQGDEGLGLIAAEPTIFHNRKTNKIEVWFMENEYTYFYTNNSFVIRLESLGFRRSYDKWFSYKWSKQYSDTLWKTVNSFASHNLQIKTKQPLQTLLAQYIKTL